MNKNNSLTEKTRDFPGFLVFTCLPVYTLQCSRNDQHRR